MINKALILGRETPVSAHGLFSVGFRFALALLMALALLAQTGEALAYGGGGGGDSGGGGSVLSDFIKNPGTGGSGGGRGNRGNWGPPPGAPPPPPDGFVEIDLVVPIRIEPVTFPEMEIVSLVEIVSGIGGHPTSGYIEVDTPTGLVRTYVLVGYWDIEKIAYDKEMGWVGITEKFNFKIKLNMTPAIRQIIANSLRGRP